jgi:hypothetical protein|tara:strand:- start:1487 stop:2809 length:1323 start_codon:yes stop_codon:yes gene_type:complete
VLLLEERDNMVHAIAVVAAAILGTATAALGPLSRGVGQIANEQLPNVVPGPGELLVLRRKGLFTPGEYKAAMLKHGFKEDLSDELFTAADANLSAGELITALRREKIDDVQFKDGLNRLGLSPAQGEELKVVTEFRAGPQDLIRMAVREVFTPGIAEKFELFSEFPEDIVPIAEQEGVSKETLERFWAAHWELPSIQLGQEMFHRLNPEFEEEFPVERSDFQDLLKAQDVMKFWRPRIEKVLFKLPTRVDIRRLLDEDVIDRDMVKQLYQQSGFDENMAELMTQLAEKFYLPEEKKLTETMILKAFSFGEVNKAEAVEMMRDIGISEQRAEFLIFLKLRQKEEDTLDSAIKTLSNNFTRGVISEETFVERLTALNLAGERINQTFLAAVEKRKDKEKLPGLADIKGFFQKQIVPEPTVKSMLQEIGVRQVDITRYLKLWS